MGAVVAYGVEKSSASRLPPLDGTISLQCLDNAGTIKYDKWGIPHIYASTRKDGYRLQGFVTAQHRCFQLAQTHLVIHGKLSSVVGSNGKPIDIFSRTCDVKGLGQKDWEYVIQHKDEYKLAIDMISGYTEGINAWLTHPMFQKPVELSAAMLKYTPECWTTHDVMSVGRLLALKMSAGWATKMISTLLIQIVGIKNAEWFCFDTEKVYQCPYNDTQSKISDFYLKLKDIGKLLEPQNQPIMGLKRSYFKDKAAYVSPMEQKENVDLKQHEKVEETTETVINMEHGGASNAFVVGGEYTDTGKPILCNDPHLDLNVPNPMFYCHLTVESDDNKDENIQWTGIQAVGMPAMCIGHTEHLAMGITVGVCDTTDIFVERFEDETSNKYEVDGEWKECRVREEVIQIKDEEDLILRVRETHHGPIFDPTDYEDGIEKGPYSHIQNADNEKYYLRYSLSATHLKPRDEIIDFVCPIETFVAVLDSKNIDEAATAFRGIAFPNLNLIVADVDGNFGWTTNGMIPIRGNIDTYNPMLPQPGWLSTYDWTQYIPQNELPTNINPEHGYVVSCNNRMVDPCKYPYYLGFRFAMGFRAKRASQLIDAQLLQHNKITMDYLKSVQTDVYDLSAEEMIHNVLNKLDIFKIIADHEIEIDNWPQSMMNAVIPVEIRNGVDAGISYYNDKINRAKAEFAWKTLSEWDYEYRTDSIGATIYDTFLTVLLRRLVMTGIYRGYIDNEERKVDDNDETVAIVKKLSENILRNTYNKTLCGLTAFLYQRFGAAITILSNDNANEECWWIKNYGNRENVLIIALIDTVDCIQFWSLTKDSTKWNWGSLHKIEVFHPISAKLGPKPFNSNVYSVSGGHHTLSMFRPNYDEGLIKNPLKVIQSAVPVWRQIIDCSNWSNSKCVLSMGTSGQVSSSFYQNMLKLLVDGEYIPMLWTEQEIEQNKISQLMCVPNNSDTVQQSDCQIL